MSRLPIRIRITLVFACAMAVLLAALGLFVYLRFEANLNDALNQTLEVRSTEIATQLRRSDAPLKPTASRILVRQEESFAQLLTPDGEIFAAAPRLRDEPLVDKSVVERARSRPRFVEIGPRPHLVGPSRLRAAPIEADGVSLVAVVGTSLDDRNESLASLRELLLIGGPAALVIASLVGYAATAAALRPVEAMRRRAAAISAADPDERLPVTGAQDELSRLGETLNEMLARLQATLERERQFVDDASHELRTPLALHKTELELALRYGQSPEGQRKSIASAIEETDRLIQLAEDLLVIARSEKGRMELELESVEVGRLLEDVGERFRARAAERGRQLIAEPGDGLRVEGDRLRLEQALTNMVDNALRYGDGPVRIWARGVGGGIEIHVSDRGPGFPPDFVDHAFERFTRADAARSRGGSGLGLAIVDGIVRSHGGRAHAVSEDGGTDVWMEIPAARS